MDQPENKTERVQLLMAPSEVAAIDDWGFQHRIRTRAEAIRRLCQIGLAYDERAGEIIKANGKVLKAVGTLHSSKTRMFSGTDPVDIEALNKMIDETLREAVNMAANVMLVAQRHIPMSKFAEAETFEETLEGFSRIPDDLLPKGDRDKS